jgi:hypothetical protein
MTSLATTWSSEYDGVTTVHPVGFALVLACGMAVLLLPRRYAVWPFIFLACFVSSAQRIVVLGADFNFLRIMVLFGTMRVLLMRETHPFRWRPVDVVILTWGVCKTTIYTILHETPAAFVFQLGTTYDAIGMYFLFRMLIRDWDDLQCVIRGVILISLPVAGIFLVEYLTHRNLFAAFGGVREVTWIREGRLRCQGAFSHPILAGAFFATLLPLAVAQFWQAGMRKGLAILGAGETMFIIYACASATPVMALAFAAAGAACFVLRRHMRWVRWSIVLAVVVLHMAMTAPVWHLLARANVVGGATGWHRYNLIDQAINRFDEWWLIGTQSTAHWGWLMFDVTNQYVMEGVRGGLLTLALFIVIVSLTFRHVGALVRTAGHDRAKLVLTWALGVSLLVHVTNFIAISYFGQMTFLWYLSLAMINSMSPAPAPKARRAAGARRIAGRGRRYDARPSYRPACPALGATRPASA